MTDALEALRRKHREEFEHFFPAYLRPRTRKEKIANVIAWALIGVGIYAGLSLLLALLLWPWWLLWVWFR